MKEFLLKQARENGHTMVRVSPCRYECRYCTASIEDDQTGTDSWQSKQTGIICSGSDMSPEIPDRIA